jgi:hypothetical protein
MNLDHGQLGVQSFFAKYSAKSAQAWSRGGACSVGEFRASPLEDENPCALDWTRAFVSLVGNLFLARARGEYPIEEEDVANGEKSTLCNVVSSRRCRRRVLCIIVARVCDPSPDANRWKFLKPHGS